MRVIAFVNQKGGVGKTTACQNIGAGLSNCGFKCLLIDLDPQSSLSIGYGFTNIDAQDVTTYEILKGADINAAIKPKKDNLDILPTDLRLSGAELELASIPGREMLLKEALEKLNDAYDYVLIDCGPSLNILTLMALTASNEVIIPLELQYYALNGLAMLQDTISLVKKRMNPGLEVGGLIATFYDSRRNLDKAIIEAVDAALPGKRFDTMLTQNTKVAEAPSMGLDIFEYDPKGKGAAQYKALVDELIKHETTEKR